ncbi:dynamin family protein [Nodularia spumigena CS-588/02]|uniref:dynamin family protein n=1 Tax=Nodularia spumigena TaxID=70799 RepID=UPI00232DB3AE|nr:dynamin family protein [Nodularia spumigena]MDB9361517.1 dynamin family protein [Nodularia spumigena CS-588/02]MDB9366127.1 dynamin family protein [Nodularia spumigena CS-588/02A10]
MPIDTDSRLNNTRKLLNELGNSVSNLVNSSPDISEDPGIKSCLAGFLAAYQEAVQRLENPSFRIATIGTTSSGKSTIVNALIGRKIAPIEAGEMSAGVLTLKHSQEQRLVIAETEDAVWETGEWTGLTDEDLYHRIRTVMHSYHDARKKREYVAPQITAYVPLLPACDPSLLGLPAGVGIELIDLPGLKSIQDSTNLATIQQQVNKAFSLVALDYMQVDDDLRKRLLDELKKVVQYLQGRTDSMIFILNRVDQRGADDFRLEVQINQLKTEIQEVLSLPEPPDVLPFNGRLLYYAQCAWGAGAFNEPSIVDPNLRLKFLKAMFQDCAGVIRLNTKENRDLKYWFRDVEDHVEDNNFVDDETMRKILRYSLEWSGGRELWDIFRLGVEHSFTEWIIIPSLVKVFDNYQDLVNHLNNWVTIVKINSQEQIEQEKIKINRLKQSIHESSTNKTEEFKNDINRWIADLKNANNTNFDQIDSRIRQEAGKNKGLKYFDQVFDTVQTIEKDLVQSLIFPVIDALKNNESAYDLEEKLREFVAPSLSENIARVYDQLSRRLGKFEKQSEFLVKRVKCDNQQEIREIEHDERYVRLLYATMRNALEARSNFLMQAQGEIFIKALDNFINVSLMHLNIDEIFASVINIEDAVTSNFKKKLPPASPKLPEDFFDIPLNIKNEPKKQSEIVREEDGSCGKKTAIYEDREYKFLQIPNIDLMGKQWSDSITQAKMNLWDIFRDWSILQLNQATELFQESVKEITDFVQVALNEKLNAIERNKLLQPQFWQNFEVQKDTTTEIYQTLQVICRGEKYE